MAGRLVHVPKPDHRCAVEDPIGEYSHAPVGSVFECACGRSWVARRNAPGVLIRRWVPEGRLARRHRRRAAERRRRREREGAS